MKRLSPLTKKIADTFVRRLHSGGTIHIEEIQDQVELELMRAGEYKVAKAYVLYREERRRASANKSKKMQKTKNARLSCMSLMPMAASNH